jgi:hypothetical protein
VNSPKHQGLLKEMEAAFEKEKERTGFLIPEYAEKPWPEDYIFKRKTQNYPWLSQERNKEVNEKPNK